MRRAPGLHLAGLALHPDRAVAGSRAPIDRFSHVDERCAGFFALGAAKASGSPLAVTCTSGTAAANLAPAVIEAHQARVPMILLTADGPGAARGRRRADDRPDRALRQRRQVVLRGRRARRDRGEAALDPHARLPRLLDRDRAARPGPVHLNFALREPLVLDGPLPEDRTARTDPRPYVCSIGRHRLPQGGAHPFGRVVIVAGRIEGDRQAAAELSAFAAQRGSRCWPIRSRVRGAGRPRSRTTTCCFATRPSPPSIGRSSCCG